MNTEENSIKWNFDIYQTVRKQIEAYKQLQTELEKRDQKNESTSFLFECLE